MKVLRLSGTGYERGFAHGTQLRVEIRKVLAAWKDFLHQHTKRDTDELIGDFLSATDFVPTIKKWTLDMIEEVRGIAEGSKQPFETVFAFQLWDELLGYLNRTAENHCTSMGVSKTAEHSALVAQNMDLESFREGCQVVLHIAPNAVLPEQLIFSCAGLIATCGMNHHSVSLACNGLMQLNASTNGLPVSFVIRGVLAQTGDDAALSFLQGVPHASGQNYVLGAGDLVYDFEASANQVTEYAPETEGVVYHTNHPLVNDDLKPGHRPAAEARMSDEKASGNSETRFAALKRHLSRPAEEIDSSIAKVTLTSKDSEKYPICRTLKEGGQCFTFGSVIMSQGDVPTMEVSAGPPDINPYIRLEFTKPGDWTE